MYLYYTLRSYKGYWGLKGLSYKVRVLTDIPPIFLYLSHSILKLSPSGYLWSALVLLIFLLVNQPNKLQRKKLTDEPISMAQLDNPPVKCAVVPPGPAYKKELLGTFSHPPCSAIFLSTYVSVLFCMCIPCMLDRYSPNVSTAPITAMGCRQCLPLSVVQLKGKHCRKPHCRNGVVDTFGHSTFVCLGSSKNWTKKISKNWSGFGTS